MAETAVAVSKEKPKAGTSFEGLKHLWVRHTRFGASGRIEFYERFEAATRMKHPVDAVIVTMLGRMESAGDWAFTAWRRIYERVRGRDPLAIALSDYVPAAERAMIAVGQQSGDWVTGFQEAKYVAEVTARIRAALVVALLYPVLLTVFGIVIIVMIATEITPQLHTMLDRPLDEWPKPTYLLNVIGEAVMASGLWVGILAGIAFVGSLWSLPRQGPAAWFSFRRTVLDRFIPPYSIFREYQSSAFLIALAALLRAGRPIDAALADLGKISSPWLRWHISVMTHRIRASRKVGDALDTGLIAPAVMSYIKDFDNLGAFRDGLEEVGRRGVERAIGRVKAQANVMRNIALVFVLALMGLIYSGMMAPGQQIYSESQSVGRR